MALIRLLLLRKRLINPTPGVSAPLQDHGPDLEHFQDPMSFFKTGDSGNSTIRKAEIGVPKPLRVQHPDTCPAWIEERNEGCTSSCIN